MALATLLVVFVCYFVVFWCLLVVDLLLLACVSCRLDIVIVVFLLAAFACCFGWIFTCWIFRLLVSC